MGPGSKNPRPEGISVRDAYRAIRSWYQANISRFGSDPEKGPHAEASKAYVASMPPPGKATHEEMLDALSRVIFKDLEWAYHESDGKHEMADYAHAAFATEGTSPFESA